MRFGRSHSLARRFDLCVGSVSRGNSRVQLLSRDLILRDQLLHALEVARGALVVCLRFAYSCAGRVNDQIVDL